jgi:pimeloyl-ACP methyl ester carboxylesterase
MIRKLAWLAAAATLLLLVCIALFTVGRGTTPGIPGPAAVAELRELELGGDSQWVLIRGVNRSHPVVLFLHGGPGMPAMYLAHDFQRPWEREFVMVHWDRLGAGKSYTRGLARDSFDLRRTLDDTHELAEWLRRRFGVAKVFLVGHSWGSYLGLVAVAERPDLYEAFVGTGQVAGRPQDVREERAAGLLPLAQHRGDEDLLARWAGAESITEEDLFRYGRALYGRRSFWPILLTGLRAREYTMRDIANVAPGANRVGRLMRGDSVPLDSLVSRVDVPVYFFLGRHDLTTPPSLAERYLGALEAPRKGIIWFEQSAHFPHWEQPERFHAGLRLVIAHSFSPE